MHGFTQDGPPSRGRGIAILIPALDPPPALVSMVRALIADDRVAMVVVGDDGSGEASQGTFATIAQLPRVHVVRHAANAGKGAALKTGIRYILGASNDVQTIVTADADGQHLPGDVLAVASTSASSPGALVIGARRIGQSAPLRSRFGNGLTRVLFRALVGYWLSDTQSGLRAFPRELASSLTTLAGSGYEYELNMLIWCRQMRVPIVERPIASVYVDGNRLSHFRPILDSIRIYSVLLKFSAVSLASAVLDNLAFAVCLALGFGQLPAFVAARLASAAFNYPVVRARVFQYGDGASAVVRYGILLGFNIVVAATVTSLVTAAAGTPVLVAKVLVEGALFFVNFVIQRDVVFRAASAPHAADGQTSPAEPITASVR